MPAEQDRQTWEIYGGSNLPATIPMPAGLSFFNYGILQSNEVT
ncbi:MAG: hypothetical protein ACI4D3_09615 [Lachnospiraceae bacterium]